MEVSMIARSGQKATIQRASSVREPGGARRTTWADLLVDISVWVQDASSQVRIAYAARELQVSKSVYYYDETAILEGDRVLYDGAYYVVRGWLNMAGLNRIWRLDVG